MSPHGPPLQYLTLEDVTKPIDYTGLFGREGPVELEVGSGRGDFLIGWAAQHPDYNLIGTERKLTVMQRACHKLGKAGVRNVVMLAVDVPTLLAEYISPRTLQTVHVYFPDPWPKRRHTHRRFFHGGTPETLLRILKPGGLVHFRTDHHDYFKSAVPIIDADRRIERTETAEELLACQTGYERRFRTAGLSIYVASWRAVGDPTPTEQTGAVPDHP